MWGERVAEAARLAQGPDPARARPLVDRLLELRPGDGDALTLSAMVAQRTGNAERALADFRAACAADEGNPARHQNLAVALKAAGAYAAAIAAFERALALRPGHAATLANLGSCLIAAGRPEAALAPLGQALAHAPGHAEAANNMGVALARLGRHREAAQHYRTALAARPDHAEAALNLADALGATGQPREAQALVAAVLERRPDQPRAANQLGLLRERAGDHAGAAAAFARGFDAAAPDHALGVNLARALIRAGDPERALGVCDRLIATQPSITTPLALRLAALERLGRPAQRDALMGVARFVAIHDFESAPGSPDMAAFDRALGEELRAHPSLTFEPEGLVTRKGRQSGELADAASPALRALAGMARERLGQALATLAAQPCDHPFLRALPREWSLTLWGTVLQPGGAVGAHIHAPNWLSGVYYPAFAPDGHDPDAGALALGLLPDELGGGGAPVVLRPRAGRMILFPSYLWHATLPFAGERERISFAFDLVPAGIGRPHRLAG